MAKKRRGKKKSRHEGKEEDPGFCSDEELVGGESDVELSEHQQREFTDPISSFDEQGEPSGEQEEFLDELPDDEFLSGDFFDEFFDEEF